MSGYGHHGGRTTGGQGNLEVPAFRGAPRALVRGVREARIKVERLVGPRVGGGSGANGRQAVAVSAEHGGWGIRGHGAMADVGIEVHVVLADGARSNRRAGRAGREELRGCSRGRRAGRRVGRRRLVRQRASVDPRHGAVAPIPFAGPGCGIMHWWCGRWRGIPDCAGDATARGLHAGQYVCREVKEPVHEDVMADVRHEANGLHIQGGKGQRGVLVLGLADSAPGSDELGGRGGRLTGSHGTKQGETLEVDAEA